jgi:transcription elongation factor GreA
MNKEKIKETLIGIQQGKVKELTERVGVILGDIDIDDNDTIDPEDLSHQQESNELLMLYKTQLEKSKNELKFLQRVDCGPHDSIQPGSIVETNQFNFFIGHTFPPINLEKGRLIRISLDSPFYEVLKTKKAGESFEFNEHNYTIISIN